MFHRRALVHSTLCLAVAMAAIGLASLAQGQTVADDTESATKAISLVFPVKQNAVCGGPCTPLNAPIMTVFDHEMQVAYECTAGEGGYGSVTAFTAESGTVKYSGFKSGAGKCNGLLFAYTNPNIASFLKGYNYSGAGVLFYDGHPGIDYTFPFGTSLYAAINGCVTY